MPLRHTRRQVMTALSLAGLFDLGGPRRALAADTPPETNRVRLLRDPGICLFPEYVAEELLRAEGFSDIRYVEVASDADSVEAIVSGKVDFGPNYASQFVAGIDKGEPVTVLGGLHVGCFELRVRNEIRGISDLKGRTIGVQSLGSSAQMFLAALGTAIGLDLAKEVTWISDLSANPLELFANGKIDAFLGFPPEPQELRARGIGHVILNSGADLPWSQYFCCMLAGNRSFVTEHPVATKRVMRAVLKATDLCAAEPETFARRLVAARFTDRYDYALQTLREIPYGAWRDYSAEDTIRFYALRLRESGSIKSTPQRIIADGTDWRFLNEVKQELKT